MCLLVIHLIKRLLRVIEIKKIRVYLKIQFFFFVFRLSIELNANLKEAKDLCPKWHLHL